MPVEAEPTCAAFVAHFFSGADEAVQQYVRESLLSAVEEGESLPEQAEVLQDFLPASCSPATFLQGLHELESALQQKPEQKPAWLQLQQPLAPLAPTPPQAAGAALEQQQQPPVAAAAAVHLSSLSVTATEFRPGAASASLSAGLGALQLEGSSGSTSAPAAAEAPGAAAGAGHDGCCQGAAAECEEGQADGWEGWDGGDESRTAAIAGGQWAAAAAAAEAQADAGGGVSSAAFLSVLADQFPLWSAEALQQLFEEQGGDLAATVQTLCGLEAELQGQQQADRGGAPSGSGALAGSAASAAQAAPSFSEDDFPSLAGPTSSSSSAAAAGTAARPATAGAYASRAAAAADLPAVRVQQGFFTRPPRRAAGAPAAESAGPPKSRAAAAAAAAGLGPAPIWQQQEGVTRYATGQALVEEYAAMRADARDHARLRNAFFQQATQAYMAGDRRLARELGAKGRWHNEQMHAAHQAAASQLFAQRNASSGGGGGAGSSGSGGGQRGAGGVQTVDLHGLHVSEALDRLDVLLVQLQARRGGGGDGPRRLKVVVGEGKHSRVPARLPACVKRYLDSQGVSYVEPYAGLLEIRL